MLQSYFLPVGNGLRINEEAPLELAKIEKPVSNSQFTSPGTGDKKRSATGFLWKESDCPWVGQPKPSLESEMHSGDRMPGKTQRWQLINDLQTNASSQKIFSQGRIGHPLAYWVKCLWLLLAYDLWVGGPGQSLSGHKVDWGPQHAIQYVLWSDLRGHNLMASCPGTSYSIGITNLVSFMNWPI